MSLHEHPPNVLLVALIGLPAAGKSTLIRQLDAIASKEVTTTIVDFDLLLQSLAKRSCCTFDPSAWKATREVFHEELSRALGGQDGQQSVVFADDNLHLRSMRRKCYQLSTKHLAAYAQIFLPCTLDLAVSRNNKRPAAEQVPADSIYKMAASLEVPTATGCIWDRDSLVATEPVDVPVLWESLKRLWSRTAVQQALAASEADTDSITEVHDFDLFCRKTISNVLKRVEARKAEVAMKLNAERRIALAKLKQVRVSESWELTQAMDAFRAVSQKVVSESA